MHHKGGFGGGDSFLGTLKEEGCFILKLFSTISRKDWNFLLYTHEYYLTFK